MKIICRSKQIFLGITLIEVIIFISLLSVLMASLLPYLVSIQQRSKALLDEINGTYNVTRGFIATTAVIVISLGVLALIVTSAMAAFLYADGIYAREMRIQRNLNMQACLDSLELMAAKRILAQGSSSSQPTSAICSLLGFPI